MSRTGEPWARRTGLSAASERARTAMLGAGPPWRPRWQERDAPARAPRRPRVGEEGGTDPSYGTYTSGPPAPRVWAGEGGGSGRPGKRYRGQDGTAPAVWNRRLHIFRYMYTPA